MRHESIVILDFGGQYNQLIARRVRENHVYCEVLPGNASMERVKELSPKGIILSGGPSSVYEEGAPKCAPGIYSLGVPVLGICYGMQLTTMLLGGRVTGADKREYGKAAVRLHESELFYGIPSGSTVCWMSHGDQVGAIPEGFRVIADTDTCPFAAVADETRRIYGVQFHPEVEHTEQGRQMLQNFLYRICGCKGDWRMSSFVEEQITAIKETVGGGRVLCGLSGGVDSSVAAVIVSKAVGRQLTCIYVDHGLMRKGETEQVERVFRDNFDINLVVVDAKKRFLDKLRGVTEPEKKRKIIGEEFIRVFEEEADKLGGADFLVQGTIYPDVIESGAGSTAVIKSHHNVGGLPKDVKFRTLIEPLRCLFKDEVREAGSALGIDDAIVWRQPFPGPGLAVRTLGAITEDRLDILREADAIFCEEVAKAGLARRINQYFAVILDQKTVGVQGDGRTYSYIIALRGVTTTDFMTADWAQIPLDVLGRASSRIVNEVQNVNRVVYDITSKPPATIEWE